MSVRRNYKSCRQIEWSIDLFGVIHLSWSGSKLLSKKKFNGTEVFFGKSVKRIALSRKDTSLKHCLRSTLFSISPVLIRSCLPVSSVDDLWNILASVRRVVNGRETKEKKDFYSYWRRKSFRKIFFPTTISRRDLFSLLLFPSLPLGEVESCITVWAAKLCNGLSLCPNSYPNLHTLALLVLLLPMEKTL